MERGDELELTLLPGLRVLARRGLADALVAATDPRAADGAARGRVRFAEVAGERAAIRHYFRGGLLGRVVRDLYLGGERAFREVRLYGRARARSVPTLEPLGAVARRAGLFWRFDLVTRAVEGAKDLGALLAEGLAAAPPRRRAAAIVAAARAVRALHDAGIEHADLNLKNLLVVDGDPPRALVIDLDRAREGAGPLGAGPRRANLLRLYRSAAKLAARDGWRLCERDVLRFARAYFQGDAAGLRATARALERYGPRIAVRRLLWRP